MLNGRLRWRVLALVPFLMLGTLAPAGQEDAGDRLRRLRREAETLALENLKLAGEEKKILGHLAELVARRDVADAELEAARAALSEVGDAAVAWEKEEVLALQRERLARQELATRLRQMERLGPTARVAVLVAAPSPVAAMAGLRAFTDAAVLDRKIVLLAMSSRERAGKAASEALAARHDLEVATLRAQAGQEAAALATQQYRQRLGKIRAEANLYAQAAAELKDAAERLQAFLGGELPEPPEGPDPLRLKGTLPWPAGGRIVQGFGPRRHPRFGTLVPHNGIAIGAPSGTDVRAISDGKVIFAGWFQGYGRTVILDHGAGLMTIQSHLSAVIVTVGQAVSQGQLLGLVGDSGSLEGVRLYFEIRREGIPVDPEGWLGHSPPV